MAKPRGRATRVTRYGLRDHFSIASPVFQAFLEGLHGQSLRDPVATLSEVEDHRFYHPEEPDFRAPQSPRRWGVTPKSLPSRGRKFKGGYSPPPIRVMAFPHPKAIIVCMRRKIRDEVLHALGKTGKGSGRPQRFTSNTKIRC